MASNWAVMLASGSSCSLLAMGPMARATDARRWTLAWLLYQVLECCVSLFGACTSWRLVISVLVMRRLAFVAATALVAVHSYGSLKRTQALFRAFDAPFILAPIGALGAYEDGTYKLYATTFRRRSSPALEARSSSSSSSTAATRRARRTRTPSFSSSRWLSFGSPTAVVGARAAAGHAAVCRGHAARRRRGARRRRRALRVLERARRVMGEWLCGSREAATELARRVMFCV